MNTDWYVLGRTEVPFRWDAYEIHRHLWKGFAPASAGAPQPFVFRRLPAAPNVRSGKAMVLFQCAAKTAFQHAVLGMSESDIRKIRVPGEGQWVDFGLSAQAIAQCSGKAAGVKKHQRSLRDASERDAWVLARLERAGLEVSSFWSRAECINERVRGHAINTSAMWAEGRARVRDRDALAQALVKGVGRGRSFGFGLLTLAVPRN